MKHLNLLALTFFIIFTACSKEDNTPTCDSSSISKVIEGTWRYGTSTSQVEFKADKTYNDPDLKLYSCTSGAYNTYGTTTLEVICGGSKFKSINVKGVSCDTLKIQVSGVGIVSLIKK